MGLRHLKIIISYMKQDKKIVSRNLLAQKFGINFNIVDECLAYLIQDKKIIELNNKHYKEFKWVKR